MTENSTELARVGGDLGDTILAFVTDRLASRKPQFHMFDLLEHVAGKGHVVAPDSPGRILRLLKGAGRVDYNVVNRSSSLYELKEQAA